MRLFDGTYVLMSTKGSVQPDQKPCITQGITYILTRIAKVTPSPFNEGDEMKLYHHPACMFETFKRARATTKVR